MADELAEITADAAHRVRRLNILAAVPAAGVEITADFAFGPSSRPWARAPAR